MAADERSHARLLQQAAGTMQGGMHGVELAQLEGRHRAGGGNALRAAVLGANDGLVSNLSLVMGVAGAELSNSAILITGMAGLLAGAFSMALGEWLSVQSSRELYQHQIEIEKAEILASPEEEEAELALIYEARGLSTEEARRLAAQISHDPNATLETLAREELNVDPAELGGSAWVAALTSFFLFAVGAIIPVIPFMFVSGTQAVTGQPGVQRGRTVCHRRRHHALHRAQRAVLGLSPGAVRPGGSGGHLRHRAPDRRESGRIAAYRADLALQGWISDNLVSSRDAKKHAFVRAACARCSPPA